MTVSSPIVLVIGCGSIGERHVRTFLRTGRAGVIACDNRPAIRTHIAATYGIEVVEDWQAALRNPAANPRVSCSIHECGRAAFRLHGKTAN